MRWTDQPIDRHRLDALLARAVAADRTPLTTYVMVGSAGVLGILAVATLMGLPVNGWLWATLYTVLAVVLGGTMLYNSGRSRRAMRRIEQAHHQVRLMDLPAAMAALEACLTTRLCPPAARAMGLVELGQIGLVVNEPASAQAALAAALDREQVLGANWLWQARICLAEAQLRCEQLTDADSTITRLRHQEPAQPYLARLDLVTCLQRLVMGHSPEVVSRAAELREGFRRHLGTDAAFGYGLLAAALHRHDRSDQAARHWLDATLLVRPQQLVRRYPVLGEVARTYEASRWPW